MTTLFLAGEGRHELGRWAREPQYRDAEPRTDGVLHALYRRKDAAAAVIGAVPWKSIRKYKAGDHRSVEERNLFGAANAAREAGADVFVWARDTDGEKSRRSDLENGMLGVAEHHPRWVGGPVEPCIEGWALDLAGKLKNPDACSKKKVQEAASAADVDSESAMLALAETANLEALTSASLRAWLDRIELRVA